MLKDFQIILTTNPSCQTLNMSDSKKSLFPGAVKCHGGGGGVKISFSTDPVVNSSGQIVQKPVLGFTLKADMSEFIIPSEKNSYMILDNK